MTVMRAVGAALSLAWGAAWYLPAWLAGAAWNALRSGWRDGSSGGVDGTNDLGD